MWYTKYSTKVAIWAFYNKRALQTSRHGKEHRRNCKILIYMLVSKNSFFQENNKLHLILLTKERTQNLNPFSCYALVLLSGVTILLSLTVFHQIVTETLPQVSDAMPLLGTYPQPLPGPPKVPTFERSNWAEIVFPLSFFFW